MRIRNIVMFLVAILAGFPIYATKTILNIYAWAGYLDEAIIQKFEQETGIRINHSTFLNNEVLYAKLKTNPDTCYDIIMPSTYFIRRLAEQKLIQKIDKSKLKNLHNINKIFLHREYDPDNEYSIPYLYTITGIVVNKKYHSEFNTKSYIKWKDLWDLKYKDKLLMLDDTREVFGIALMSLGYSINDKDPQHIQEAFTKLKLLMSNVKLFNTETQRSMYLDEDITIGMGWNGDAYLAHEENPNLMFLYPTDGFLVALDCLAIPKNAKNIDAAMKFIDFVLRGTTARDIALLTGYSTPNVAGLELLPKKMQVDPILYPDANIMKRARFFNDLGNSALLYEKYFELLKL